MRRRRCYVLIGANVFPVFAALYYWLPKMTGRMMNLSRSTWGSFHNGGMGNQEWAVVVNREGVGCAVVFSGTPAGDEWPASRVIAASKANTANGVSNNLSKEFPTGSGK